MSSDAPEASIIKNAERSLFSSTLSIVLLYLFYIAIATSKFLNQANLPFTNIGIPFGSEILLSLSFLSFLLSAVFQSYFLKNYLTIGIKSLATEDYDFNCEMLLLNWSRSLVLIMLLQACSYAFSLADYLVFSNFIFLFFMNLLYLAWFKHFQSSIIHFQPALFSLKRNSGIP